jgi:hypothetical protein
MSPPLTEILDFAMESSTAPENGGTMATFVSLSCLSEQQRTRSVFPSVVSALLAAAALTGTLTACSTRPTTVGQCVDMKSGGDATAVDCSDRSADYRVIERIEPDENRTCDQIAESDATYQVISSRSGTLYYLCLEAL